MILPKQGPVGRNISIHIYGRNFTRGMCKQIRCMFDAKDTHGTQEMSSTHPEIRIKSISAEYISDSHIICTAPDPREALATKAPHIRTTDNREGAKLSVKVSVDLGDGIGYRDTGLEFTYIFESSPKGQMISGSDLSLLSFMIGMISGFIVLSLCYLLRMRSDN